MDKIDIILDIVAKEFNLTPQQITDNKYSYKVYVDDVRAVTAQLLRHAGVDKLTISFVLRCYLKTVDKLLDIYLELDDLKAELNNYLTNPD